MSRARHLRRGFALRAVACSLAALHALIAGMGDGLHAWQHGDVPHASCSHAEPPSTSHCGGSCPCESSAPTRARVEASERGVDAGGQFDAPAEKQPSHDHDCAVCQLMAQLKTSTPPAEIAICISEPTVQWVASLQEVISSRTPERLSARGPPAGV